MNLAKAHIFVLLDAILEDALVNGDIPCGARGRIQEELVHMGLLEERLHYKSSLRGGQLPPVKLTLAGHAVLDLAVLAANTGAEWRFTP